MAKRVSVAGLAGARPLGPDALASLPEELRHVISNVAIVVEGEPPHGQPLLGLIRAFR